MPAQGNRVEQAWKDEGQQASHLTAQQQQVNHLGNVTATLETNSPQAQQCT